jgi:periplasmic divalent cation tolerance protein
MTDGSIVVLITTSTPEEGQRIADELVNRRVAACVTLVREVASTYRWQGEVRHDRETLLIVKTHRDRFADLTATVTRLHSYEVPEIIAVPIVAGAEPYLAWLRESVTPT